MSESNPYQALLEQLQACGNQDERERLLMRFTLERLPEPLRVAVQAAAVPRFFDLAFLNALLDQPLDEAQFAELTGLSYIEPYPGEGRFNVHERSRKLLQEKLWQEDEALYREISHRAFVYCAKQDQDDTTWRIETVYHQFIAEPEKGIVALNACIEWMNAPYFTPEKTGSLLQALREHLEERRLTERAAHFFWLRQAQLDIRYGKFENAIHSLQQIPSFALLKDHYLNCEYIFANGVIHKHLSRVDEAKQYLEKAFLLNKERGQKLGEANSLYFLGDTYLSSSDYQEARRFYDEAIDRYREIKDQLGEANCLKSLGDLSINVGEFIDSEKYYEKSASLYKSIQCYGGVADCLERFAKLHQAQGQLQQAEECWQKLAAMYRQLAMPMREQHCLEQLRQMKEQKQPADVSHEVSDKQTPPADE